MTKRLERIFSEIPKCDSFADVGCDHGFIAEKMILSGKCSNVTITDISAKSLQKAKNLLKTHIEKGVVNAICTDGLKDVSNKTETVLIAGMGGEEIIKILQESAFLPPVLILQPMKNVDKVRRTLFETGYGIVKDYLFYDKKYYNLIVARLNEKVLPYSENEFIFGRDNLKTLSDDFRLYLSKELSIINKSLSLVESDAEKIILEEKLKLYKEVINGN